MKMREFLSKLDEYFQTYFDLESTDGFIRFINDWVEKCLNTKQDGAFIISVRGTTGLIIIPTEDTFQHDQIPLHQYRFTISKEMFWKALYRDFALVFPYNDINVSITLAMQAILPSTYGLLQEDKEIYLGMSRIMLSHRDIE